MRTLAILIAPVVFVIYFLLLPEMQQVQITPDDGYFYQTLARNFHQTGNWTLDGIHPTSGFHLLYAYLCSVVPSLWLSIGFTFVFISIMLWQKMYGLAIIVTSANFLFNMVGCTEWSLVILIAVLYYLAWQRRSAWIFGLAILGMLARSDFFILPTALLIQDYVKR